MCKEHLGVLGSLVKEIATGPNGLSSVLGAYMVKGENHLGNRKTEITNTDATINWESGMEGSLKSAVRRDKEMGSVQPWFIGSMG